MQVPLEINFRGLEGTAEIESLVEKKVARLEKFCDYITRCRVVIERPHRHESSGNPYQIVIDMTVPPGHELVVKKKPGDHDIHDELQTVINNAFHAAERELKELVERQRDDIKTHEEPRALVERIFHDEGYGFIKTLTGEEEIYFHENSVIDDDFDRLTVGTEVRFEQSMGEMGPQATTVKIVGKPGVRAERTETEERAAPADGTNAETEE